MPKRFEIEAEALGGSDIEDWPEYELPDETAYFDKPDHFERSAVHQPNHTRAARRSDLLTEEAFNP